MEKPTTKDLRKLFEPGSANDFLHAYLYLKYMDLYVYFFGSPGGAVTKKDAARVLAKYPPEVAEMVAHAVKVAASTLAHPQKNTYHAKVLNRDLARKIITLDRKVEMRQAETIIPYQTANDIILRQPKAIAVMNCACRELQENPCAPMEVCLWIGDPFVSFIVEHHPEKARRIDEEEALSIIETSDKEGYVHHAFFKKEMGNRFYCICNCCSCCCLAMQAWHKGFKNQLRPSGFAAVVDAEKCIGCGECEEACPFKAVSLDPETDRAVVDFDTCMGCGICAGRCETGSISLKREPAKGTPFDVEALS